MKYTLSTLFFLVLFSSFIIKNKNRAYPKLIDVDYVTYGSVQIKKQSVTQKITMLSTKTQMESAFGAPVLTSSETSEMDGRVYVKNNYNADNFYFDGTGFASLDFKSTIFFINCDGNDIKVGNSIYTLHSIFPNSYNEKKKNQLFVGIKTSKRSISDSFLIFDFDDQTGFINRIAMQ